MSQRSRCLLVAVPLTVLLAMLPAGCSGGSPAKAPPPNPVAPAATVPASGAAASSAAVPDDPSGSAACSLLADAIARGTVMDAGVVDSIVAATASADAPVADSAQRLVIAYRAGLAAAGTDSEPDAIAAVSAAAADMSDICADSGLRTVG